MTLITRYGPLEMVEEEAHLIPMRPGDVFQQVYIPLQYYKAPQEKQEKQE